ncbi:Mut7-C RNAse domain-containing protein [Halobacterium rubrum]|uniref:Mut7-C RNAse domain-containing protein n=1 Tax=Halobacterium TaxID=2239 RepID=UPI001F1A22B3|nr:DUF5615 family PIN-like protein [Halobacterium rubrum]MDH5021593.1 DUF5615 family PIN-like protein [Halobacterium rubrum]
MKLLADAMLGSLARICRMCGHDTAYCLDRGVEADDDVLALAKREERTLLTRDRQLAARAPDSLLLESKTVDDQLAELAAAGVDLLLSGGERCGACNGELRELRDGEAAAEYVPDDAGPVWACRDCGQQFYRGSHWDDVEDRLP